MSDVPAKPLNNRQKANLISKNVQKASNLLTQLEKNALGALTVRGEPYEMTAGQIKSAEIFLKKTMPDLQSIDSTVTMVDERTVDEMKDEAMNFLMKAGMSEADAEKALKKMAQDVTH